MPQLPEAIWKRRLDGEYQEMLATGIPFRVSPDKTEYTITIKADGLERTAQGPKPRAVHEVFLKLKRDYPYAGGLDVQWLTPIFHPNIRDSDGKVCIHLLTNWGASVTVAELARGMTRMVENPNTSDPLDKEANAWFVAHRQHPSAAPARVRPRVV
jgi:ubiquitin-protein ligase